MSTGSYPRRLAPGSLRARLLWLTVLALLPAAALMVFVSLDRERNARQRADAGLLQVAELMAGAQQQQIARTRDLLALVASLPELRSGDVSACQARLAATLPLYPQYVGLAVFDLNGDTFCTSSGEGTDINVADRLYFQQALATQSFAVGEYQVGRRINRPVLGFGYPVLDEAGLLFGVLYTGVELSTLNASAAETPLPAESVLTIVDRNGLIMVREPGGAEWTGQPLPEPALAEAIVSGMPGTLQVTGADGVPRLYAFTPIHGLPNGELFLSVGVPLSVIYAEANQVLVRNLLWVAAVIPLVLLASLVWGRLFIVRPVQQLERATQRLASGDLSARLGSPPASGELGRLGLAFDDMAGQLQRRFQHLQSIYHLAEAVTRAGSLEHIYTAAIDGLEQALRADRASILLFDPDGVMRFKAWRGLSDAYRQATSGHSPWTAGVTDPEPIVVADVAADLSLGGLRPVIEAEGIRALAFFPLMASGRLLGKFMLYYNTPRALSTEDVQLGQALASHIALAVERAQGEAALSAQAAALASLNQAAQALNAELEARVTARTAELRQANAQLADANQALQSEVAERARAEAQLARSHQQLRQLSARLHAAREEERARIAREIHDELGQELTGLKMDIRRLSRLLEENDLARLKKKMAEMPGVVDGTINTVRRIASDLRPSLLDDFGLPAAIEWQCLDFQNRFGLPCRLESTVDDDLSLPADTATAVFRVFQETLTNIVRHAQATEVVVRLWQEAGHLALEVRDNGRGITPAEIAGAHSLGLLGMRERVQLLAGTIHIHGVPGQGTTVCMRVPLAG